jgi:Pyruvate/2-oxoacid:ferredoxin oxidoreductase delta subunit
VKDSSTLINRRFFLKSFPQALLQGLRSLTADRVPISAREGALEKDFTGPTKEALAYIDVTRCLAWEGTSCQACYLACPIRDEAIEMDDQKPVIIVSGCDGCTLCVDACKTVNDLGAIRMVAKQSLRGALSSSL